ncbi:MAG TPA: G8 domain-containing protein, partial [Ktedonobacteraceae bacterium]|nr:G8 domain-containing protein [Ktedonobacteraceae bacterium]
MLSHSQGRRLRWRSVFLVALVLVTVVTSTLAVWRLFASARTDQIKTATGATNATGEKGTPTVAQPKWSDPATWQGKLPTAGSAVTIPAGKTILLDTNPPALKSLSIQGNLICAEKDLSLSANLIMVLNGGMLQCGSETQPFQHHLVITLTGSPSNASTMDMGTKLLGVVGGKLELHGQAKVNWVHLGKTAYAGTNQLLLDQEVNWSKGDRLVVASTD